MNAFFRIIISTSSLMLIAAPVTPADPISSYNLDFLYKAQPTDPNSNGSWSGTFDKSVNWNQTGSIGFDKNVLGTDVGATLAGWSAGALRLTGTLQAADSSVTAGLSGKLQINPLSSPQAGVVRVGTNYTPTSTKFETSIDNVQFKSNLAVALTTGVGAQANVGSYGFSSNLNSNGSVASPNLGIIGFSTPVLTYNQNGSGKVSVFGSPSFSLPGNGLVPVPTGLTGFSAKVDINPSLNTLGYGGGFNIAKSGASLPTAAQFSFATSAADVLSPLPFAPELTGTLGSLIPDPKSSNPVEEIAYKAVEAALGALGFDALETTLKLNVGYQSTYSLAPSQTLNYNLHVAQTGQDVSGNTNIGYADIQTEGQSRLTIRPTVDLVNPIFTEKSFLTITPEIGVQGLTLDGFGQKLGPLFNEDYSPTTFLIPLPTASGSIELGGTEQLNLDPFTIEIPSATIAPSPTPVPEPTTFLLLGTSLIGLGLMARRKP